MITTIPMTMVVMEQHTNHQCWNFVMSSFARIYGVREAENNMDLHYLALEWCDEHNYVCDVHLDDLRKVDVYFRNYYEEFKNGDRDTEG